MPDPIKVLFAGESWMTHSIHVKGYDSFEMSSYHEGGTELIAALRASGIDVTYQPSHIAANDFPTDTKRLAEFDVVILSDIGANTLLLPDRTAIHSQRTANRLSLIADFVANGGGLLMVGGYLTFQGIQAKGNYKGTPVEDVLPVTLQATDDRREQPQGVIPEILLPNHPIVSELSGWPHFLGFNTSTARSDADLIACFGEHPFIAARKVAKGRSAIFSADCGPHWGPPEFVNWDGYPKLWVNLVTWLAGQN